MALFDDIYGNSRFTKDRQNNVKYFQFGTTAETFLFNLEDSTRFLLSAGTEYTITLDATLVASRPDFRHTGDFYIADLTTDATGNTALEGTSISPYEIVGGEIVTNIPQTQTFIVTPTIDTHVSVVQGNLRGRTQLRANDELRININTPNVIYDVHVRLGLASISGAMVAADDESIIMLETPTPDHLLGQIFHSTHNTPSDGLLYMGETYNWIDNPKLKKFFDVNNHGFIIDNGTTFTIAEHSDFIRAGITNIGIHVDDTTAVNNLAGITIDHNPTSPNLTTRQAGGNVSRNRGESQTPRDVALTSPDDETAPDHRTAFFGIYGDFSQTSIGTSLVEPVIGNLNDVDLSTAPAVGESLIWNGTSFVSGGNAEEMITYNGTLVDDSISIPAVLSNGKVLTNVIGYGLTAVDDDSRYFNTNSGASEYEASFSSNGEIRISQRTGIFTGTGTILYKITAVYG